MVGNRLQIGHVGQIQNPRWWEEKLEIEYKLVMLDKDKIQDGEKISYNI